MISITQQKKGDARNAVRAAFAAYPAVKQVVIVDDDIDIFDNTQVEWALATRFQADRDLIYSDGTGGFCSSSPSEGSTKKVGFDATR